MITILAVFAGLFAFYFALTPIIKYLQDPKGFRKYPNENLFSGISSSAHSWEIFRKHKVFHTKRLHETLMKKPVVRLGPNWLSFGSSRAVKDIYGYTSQCMKAPIYDLLQGGGQHLVNISSRSLHSSRRRMVATAYAPRNIEAWEPDVTASTAKLLEKINTMCTAPLPEGQVPSKDDLKFEAMHWSFMFAYECVIKIGMSKDMGFVEAGNDLVEITDDTGATRKVNSIDCLHSGSRAASTLIWDTDNFPMYKNISAKISPWYASQWSNAGDWRRVVEKVTKERIARYDAGETFNDLFQPMLEDKVGKEADIDSRDRVAEVDQMINGGGDGPGISLANTLYYLVKNPETLSKLREELDAALAPEDKIAPWAKIKTLPYLRACVDESMRLAPPVATDLVRLTPDEGQMVDGQMIPGNTVVSISAYTAHRDPEVFVEPDEFRPERWLIKGDDRLKDMLAAYIPFSAGSRACIGRNVTILMQLVFVATLASRYEFALPSADWEMDWEDYFNMWPKELPLKVWNREMSQQSQLAV